MKTEYLNNKVFEGIINRFQDSKKQIVKYKLIIDDLQMSLDRKSKKNTNVDREKSILEKNQLEYAKILEERLEAESLLTQAFYTLAQNLVRFARFNLIDSDDVEQESVMICFEKIDRFDPSKGKAFNYFTTMTLNNMRQLFRSAKNYNQLKRKYHEFLTICENNIIIKNGREIAVYNP